MALKRTVTTLDDVIEAHRALYVARDGVFVLDVEGDDGLVPAAKLNEFRDSNRRLNAELKAANEKLATYDGIDPAAARAALAAHSQDDPAKPNAQTAAAMRRIEALEQAIKSEQDKAKAAEERLAQTRISDVLREAARQIGVHAEMIDDVIQLPAIRGAWRLNERGETVAVDGDQPIYGKDAVKPITAAEFLQSRLHKVYFAPSTGGGVQGNGSGANPGANQMRRADFDKLNPIEQRQFVVEKKGAVLD